MSKPRPPSPPNRKPDDAGTDYKSAQTHKRMPSPDSVNVRDDELAAEDKPLLGDSAEAKVLHDRPPRGKDQLDVGPPVTRRGLRREASTTSLSLRVASCEAAAPADRRKAPLLQIGLFSIGVW